MFVEQLVDEALEAADLATRRAVLVDERLKPFEPVRAGGRRIDVGIDVFEAAQAFQVLLEAVGLQPLAAFVCKFPHNLVAQLGLDCPR